MKNKLFIIILLITILFSNYTFAQNFTLNHNKVKDSLTYFYDNKSIKYKNVNGKIYPFGVLGVYETNNKNLYSSRSVNSISLINKNYSYDDFYWLSRIIHAESEGESYTGKVAVGSVVINRINSRHFPNTMKGVIFEKNKTLAQFTPISTGSIINTPSEESMSAAIDVLKGSRPVGNALFFLNPATASSNWIINNRNLIKKIDNHMFYD
ncbi:MAG: cell wall hydrolase [Senegalia sp. (in: firmicutes)]|uniref:cell wall hydrolase n=1 Tax=Senegalia sp. (in: firmicutes) TaxID=1924098 RepID=UPI003F9D645B